MLPVCSNASSINVGFNIWYASWIAPSLVKQGDEYINWGSSDVYPPNNHYKTTLSPNMIYGPSLYLYLPHNIFLGTNFQYSQFIAEKKGQIFVDIITIDKIGLNKRYDWDINLGYSFIEYMNIFIGFKYDHYSFKIISISNTYNTFFASGKRVTDDIYNEYSPLLGLGFFIPIIKYSLMFNINIAALFCVTDLQLQEYYFGKTEYSSKLSFIPPMSKMTQIKKIGVNADCKLKYSIPVISINITTGFRYQMLKKLKIEYNRSMEYEHLYGITASVDYSIDLEQFRPKVLSH